MLGAELGGAWRDGFALGGFGSNGRGNGLAGDGLVNDRRARLDSLAHHLVDQSVFLGLGRGRFGGLGQLLLGLPAFLLQAETGGVVVATAELADR